MPLGTVHATVLFKKGVLASFKKLTRPQVDFTVFLREITKQDYQKSRSWNVDTRRGLTFTEINKAHFY